MKRKRDPVTIDATPDREESSRVMRIKNRYPAGQSQLASLDYQADELIRLGAKIADEHFILGGIAALTVYLIGRNRNV